MPLRRATESRASGVGPIELFHNQAAESVGTWHSDLGFNDVESHDLVQSARGGQGTTHGGRRKQIALWTCCNCGNSGMSMRVDPCSYCQTPRCVLCPVSKIKSFDGVRGRDTR
ncbi:hypothetical protein BGZ63DRAFT_77613 [Mariannaea sp. PMI_226]|nr:hypothetical protein BGZ63DRAFT_77613 [Mariannaea sp. PMI_226]